jgi:hypothetical protein
MQIPTTIEDAVHALEGACAECDISRKYDPSLSLCPSVSCTRASVDNVFSFLRSNGCASSCSSACGNYFLELVTLHDKCSDTLMTTAEEDELHNNYETPCAAYRCNDVSSTQSVVCSSASTVAVAVVSTIVLVAVAAF